MRHLLLLSLVLIAAACAPTPPPPTLTATIEPSPTATETPTARPLPNTTPLPAAARSEPAFLHIIHAAPAVPTVDFYIGQIAIAPNLGYTRYTDATPIDAGAQTIRMLPGGSRADADSLLEVTVALQPGQTGLLLLADAQKLTLISAADPLLNDDSSALRVIHAVTGMETLQFALGDAALQSVRPGEVTPTQITAPGEVALRFEQNGTLIRQETQTLRAQRSHTVILLGTADDVRLIALDSSISPGATIRLLHAAESLGAVAALVGSDPLTRDLPFKRASERLFVGGGIYELAIYPANADPQTEPPLVSGRVEASVGESVAVILSGTADDLRLSSFAEDRTPTSGEQFRITFFNALPSIARAQVGEALSLPLSTASELVYAGEPGSALLTAGTQTLVWAESDGTEPVETALDLIFEAGHSYLYVLTGAQSDPFIVSDEVGILERVAAATPLPDISSSAQFRFINALSDGSDVDFALDDAVVAAGLRTGEASGWLVTEPGSQRLEVRAPGGAGVRAQLDVDFEAGRRYSVYAYRNDANSARLLVAPADGMFFNNDAGRIRLINLSARTEIEFSLATTDALPAAVAVPTSEWESGDLRMSLPFGNQLFISDVAQGEISEAVSIEAGSYDVMIVDEVEFGIARQLNAVEVGAGELVDVVAFMAMTTRRVDAFAVVYDAPSD
jgi:hypothetical protein